MERLFCGVTISAWREVIGLVTGSFCWARRSVLYAGINEIGRFVKGRRRNVAGGVLFRESSAP